MNHVQYIFPSLVAASILSIILLYKPKATPVRITQNRQEAPLEYLAVPGRRVLTVVVEEKLIYMGEGFCLISDFEEALRSVIRDAYPDHIVVAGTDLTRFGDLVKVYCLTTKVFGPDLSLETIWSAKGARRELIENYYGFGLWDDDKTEAEQISSANVATRHR